MKSNQIIFQETDSKNHVSIVDDNETGKFLYYSLYRFCFKNKLFFLFDEDCELSELLVNELLLILKKVLEDLLELYIIPTPNQFSKLEKIEVLNRKIIIDYPATTHGRLVYNCNRLYQLLMKSKNSKSEVCIYRVCGLESEAKVILENLLLEEARKPNDVIINDLFKSEKMSLEVFSNQVGNLQKQNLVSVVKHDPSVPFLKKNIVATEKAKMMV